MLSRNFRLQKIGDIRWIERNYNFQKVAKSIDELVVLNVSREGSSIEQFSDAVKRLVQLCFIPVATGGNIRSIEDAIQLFNSGADKIVINSPLIKQPELVNELSKRYGAQSLIASIDCKKEDTGYFPYINNGTEKVDQPVVEYLKSITRGAFGEIYLNSIDRDGTGHGYDIELLKTIMPFVRKKRIPLIVAGGAGKSDHFLEIINEQSVDAVATANLLNFIGDALPKARTRLLESNVLLPDWPV